jgi:hypothetical protein
MTDRVIRVAMPLGVGNFIMECMVDGMALSFLIPDQPSITLYGEGDLTTANFMIVWRYNPSLPKHTSSSIFPNGFMASPANPISGVFVFVKTQQKQPKTNHQYSPESGKALMDAVEFRFGGNDATKKSRKNMLKHQFENFTSESGEKIINNVAQK